MHACMHEESLHEWLFQYLFNMLQHMFNTILNIYWMPLQSFCPDSIPRPLFCLYWACIEGMLHEWCRIHVYWTYIEHVLKEVYMSDYFNICSICSNIWSIHILNIYWIPLQSFCPDSIPRPLFCLYWTCIEGILHECYRIHVYWTYIEHIMKEVCMSKCFNICSICSNICSIYILNVYWTPLQSFCPDSIHRPLFCKSAKMPTSTIRVQMPWKLVSIRLDPILDDTKC